MKNTKERQAPDLVAQICHEMLPCQKLTADHFWRLCAEYPRREAASVYLYRLWPIIDRHLAGVRFKNIDKWAVDEKPINEDRILALHGSGRYRLTFNDANRPRPLKQVAETTVTIERSDRPPVVPVEELVLEHPDNRSYVQGLRAAGQLKQEAPMNGEGKAVEQLAAVSRQLLQERAGRRDELLALKLVEMLKPKRDPVELAIDLQKLAAGHRDDVLLKTLLDAHTRLTEAMLKERGEEGGELARIERVINIAGKLGLAPRGGRTGTDWGAALQGSLDKVATIVLGLPAVLRELRRGAGADRIAAAEPGLPNQLPAAPQALQVDASPETAQAAEPEAEVEEDSAPTMEALSIVGRRAIEAYQSGKSGAEFGASLKLVEPELYGQLRAIGKAGIIAALSMVPGIWDQIGSERGEVEAWLDSFFAEGEAVRAEPKAEAGGRAAARS